MFCFMQKNLMDEQKFSKYFWAHQKLLHFNISCFKISLQIIRKLFR
jgi:hypothetical protein